MNPIYKTGWGQYVDLEKIVSIESDGGYIHHETRGMRSVIMGVRIHAQLCESPILRNLNIQIDPTPETLTRHFDGRNHIFKSGDRVVTDREELQQFADDFEAAQKKSAERASAILESQISALIMAWESYRNR
jgi:hypothetical protein